MKREERDTILKDLKAQFYDVLSTKERCQQQIQFLNNEIEKLRHVMVDDDESGPPKDEVIESGDHTI